MRFSHLFFTIFLIFTDAKASIAQNQNSDHEIYLQKIENQILDELAKKFPDSKIKCSNDCTSGLDSSFLQKQALIVESIEFHHDTGDGRATFNASWRDAEHKTNSFNFTISFHAWRTVPIAKKRISPMQKLSKNLFRFEELDFSRGVGRQYRDLVLSDTADFSNLEARNTILEGHFPLLNGIQKIPLVRRGDPIKVILLGNGLKLSTPGTALKPGYRGEEIQILTEKNKRKLSGTLNQDRTVEVSL